MVLGAGDAIDHAAFETFPQLLRRGDVLVINETRVIRARLPAVRRGGGAAELLLLRPRASAGYDSRALEWLALVRPGRKVRAGSELQLRDGTVASIVDVLPDGPRVVRFPAGTDVDALLERNGDVPLPPYVGKRSDEAGRAARYQTVFARVPGSVAAPTASLHFTPAILERIRQRGVTIAPVVLDVGIGTFRPMSGTLIDEHVMHAERYAIPAETAAAIARAKAEGSTVVAAGTTVLRALEGDAAIHGGEVRPGEGETSLFVTPGFHFRVVDALLTNFHLPRSTLLVLVAAFAGYERTLHAYAAAIEESYRFFSFGDAMFTRREEFLTER